MSDISFIQFRLQKGFIRPKEKNIRKVNQDNTAILGILMDIKDEMRTDHRSKTKYSNEILQYNNHGFLVIVQLFRY